jgi:hypothetical protein
VLRTTDDPTFRAEQDAMLVTTPEEYRTRSEVALYFDVMLGRTGAGREQGFLVHMPAGDTIGAHFHRIDQYQLFFGNDTGTYQRTPLAAGSAMIHYTDAYTVYGPFSSGSEPLDFFTLRVVGDPVTEYMPEGRAKQIHRGTRHVTGWIQIEGTADLDPGSVVTSEILVGEGEDDFSCMLVRAGAGAHFELPRVGTGPQYACVVSGAGRTDGCTIQPKALGWIPAGAPLPNVEASDESGVELVVMQFAAAPSYPFPEREQSAGTLESESLNEGAHDGRVESEPRPGASRPSGGSR